MSTSVTTSGSTFATGSGRPTVRNLCALAASLTLVLVSSLTLVMVTAAPAAAKDPTGSISGGGTSNPNVPKGNPPGGPRTKYTPKPTTDTYETFPYMVGWIPACAVKADGRVPVSVTSRFIRITAQEYNSHAPGYYKTLGGNYYKFASQWCNYMPEPTITDVSCAQSVKITINGPMSKPVTIFGPKTTMSAWSKTAASRKNVTLCGTSVSQFADVKLPQLGRYKMDVLVGLVPCQRWDYPGGAQPSVIKGCGGAVFVPKVFLAQQWCNGASKDWSGTHSFTMAECGGPTPISSGPWSCNVPSVTMDSRSAPHAVMDDGKVHPAKWQTTKVKGAGVRKVGSWKTQVTVKPGSDPSRDGAQDSNTQPYLAPSAKWVTGDQATNKFQWFSASTPGSQWTMTRRVGFTAQFSTPSVTIKSVNLLTGEMTVVTTYIWRTGTATCESAPLDVTVSRARNVR